MYGDPVFIYQILKCCLAEKWSQKTCLWREGEIPRVDNVKVSKKETDMENGGISISLLVLGIIHRAAGIGSCTCTIFFVPSVFQINAIWQRLEFGKAPPKWWICGIVGAKRSIDSECRATPDQWKNGMDGGECEVVSDTKNRSGEMSCVTWDVCSSVTLLLELAFG